MMADAFIAGVLLGLIFAAFAWSVLSGTLAAIADRGVRALLSKSSGRHRADGRPSGKV